MEKIPSYSKVSWQKILQTNSKISVENWRRYSRNYFESLFTVLMIAKLWKNHFLWYCYYLFWYGRNCYILETLLKKDRSSRPEVFCKKVVLRNFAKFKGKHLCQDLLFNKPQAYNFIKREALVQLFSFEFWEIFKKTFS